MNKKVAILVFVLSFVLSIAFFVFKDFFAQTRSLGLLGLFIINFVSNASFFVSAPAMITVVAGGAIYPPFLVALVSSLGSAFGDMLGFILGLSTRKLVNHKLNQKIWFAVLDGYFKKHGAWIVFVFALVPNPFFDSIGILAGVFIYSPLKFFLIVFLGRFLRYLLLAGLGSRF